MMPRQKKKRRLLCKLAPAVVAFLLIGSAQAQVSPSLYDYPRQDLDWYTIETENFKIHFHVDESGRGSSRTAQVAASVAEDIYGRVTELYDYEPGGKVSIVLIDYEDYSNGAAYFFDNKIEIWAPSLDSPLRGDHNWLRNVITHEFTHMVQLQKAMKAGRQWPMAYFQWMAYEDVKRPDVLYGYPNIIMSYPMPVVNTPAWFAEGTAQFQRAELHYDTWDTHRDMLLRTRVLEDKAFSLQEMGGFYSHTGLGREGVYNQGYAFVQYLVDEYGEEALRDISESLSKWRNWNVERAMREALGRPANAIFADWMASLEAGYRAGTKGIHRSLVEGEIIQDLGAANYFPRFSPDGSKIAYISNRGEDYNLLALYVYDVSDGALATYPLDGLATEHFAYHCAFGERIRGGVQGTFTWDPDGQSVIFSRVSDTRQGHRYADLYRINLETKEEERLTHGRRAASPAVSPAGRLITFVSQSDGSTNLHLLDRMDGSVTKLTDFRDGTQATDPVWHPSGDWVYFTRGLQTGRSLGRVSISGKVVETVIEVNHEIRTPTFDASGENVLFASDTTGIFNIYRAAVSEPGEWQQLTNVIGGAFMPDVGPDGTLLYAHFTAEGYKLARMTARDRLDLSRDDVEYVPPAMFSAKRPHFAARSVPRISNFDDTDVVALSGDGVALIRESGSYEIVGNPGSEPVTVQPYRDDFTAFSFMPVVRLDEYVTSRSRSVDAQIQPASYGRRLWRNTKMGFYTTSREMLDGLTFFGGLMVGPGSSGGSTVADFFVPDNLLKMERDAFLQFEYRKGVPFIKGRWSPTVSVELYNIRRNVEQGLAVEEFPCTACYPETSFADVAYTLWEGNLALRSKVNRSLLLEAAYRYSPYQVRVERFFSREMRQTIPGSSTRYFIGRGYTLKGYYEGYRPHRHANVVPDGLRLEAGYEFEPGRLLDRFDLEDGMLVPRYNAYRNHRFFLDARIGRVLPGSILGDTHGLGLRLKASTILGSSVDSFFNDYVGGLVGARGYPFYALGGNETAWIQLSYHFPIIPSLNRQLLFLYADKLYGRIYADAAAAWSGGWPGAGVIRRDAGAELRLGIGSFYLFPTALFVSATYGFDRFDLELPEGFLTPDGLNFVTYGRELQWHFGLLFSFDL